MTSVVRVLQPSGILDGNSANDLARDVVAHAQADATIVLLDLSEVEFINSSGIGALVSALKATKQLGAELYICSPSFQVRDIFRITKMNKLFKIFLTREEFEKETGMSVLV
ncbi:MAG: STAS domain-containing protein [Cyanobacteria bacterium P01_D01_bin.56]